MRTLFLLTILRSLASPEVVLQYFEAGWDEIHHRIPEIAEVGYDGIWIPSLCCHEAFRENSGNSPKPSSVPPTSHNA